MKKGFLLFFWVFFIAFNAFCSSAAKNQITLMLQDSSSGLSDQTVIYFQQGTSVNYIFPEDDIKTLDTTQALPQLYSFSADNIPCYSNGYGDFTSSTIIPLGIWVPGNGPYIFSITQTLNFDPATIILLEDRASGTFTNLRTGNYSISNVQSGQNNGRFYIHFSFPPVITAAPSGCTNSDGAIGISEDSSITWSSCQLYNSYSVLVGSLNNISGNMIFTNLPSGNYNVQFTYQYYSVTKSIAVATNQVTATMNVSTNQAAAGQEISFYSNGTNATQYEWDFGDGTIITGVTNTTYAYLAAGIYTPKIKYSNTAGCTAYADTTINIQAPTAVSSLNANTVSILSLHQNIRISIGSANDNSYQYDVYNIIGQTISTGPVASPDFTVSMSNQPNGVYIVTLTNGSSKYSKKIVLN